MEGCELSRLSMVFLHGAIALQSWLFTLRGQKGGKPNNLQMSLWNMSLLIEALLLDA